MKTLRDYIAETEEWIDEPQAGDAFDIELAPDHLIETVIVETTADGIVIEADEHLESLLESRGWLAEKIGTYGAVGYGGMGQTFFEKDQVAEHGGGIGPREHWQDLMQEEPVEEGSDQFTKITTSPDKAWQMLGGKHPVQFVIEVLCPNRSVVKIIRKQIDRDYEIIKDDSIEGNGIGIAIISPVFEGGRTAQSAYEQIFEIIRQSDGEFNNSTQAKIYRGKQAVAEGDYPDGSSLQTPSVDEWKQEFLKAKNSTMKSKTRQEYEYWSDRASRIQELLASRGVNVGPVLGQQGMAEGGIKAQDIELQDYKSMTPQEFERAYGMKKADWAMKHHDLIGKEHLQVDWTGKTGFDYVRETSAYMSRMLELAGVADHRYDKQDDVYHEDQSANIVAKKELDIDAAQALGERDEDMEEAKYQGREVPLGKPMAGDVKKSKVYVRGPKGNVVKVNFGDKKMKIKKSNPKRRKSFRARHNCANPGPRWKARYWSCRAW